MNKNRPETIRFLRKYHIETSDILRHGSFDGTIGIKRNYTIPELKKWLVWSGVEIGEYRD